MIPSAIAGSTTRARIAAAANAAPEPKPPFEMPAKVTAAPAIAKNAKSNRSALKLRFLNRFSAICRLKTSRA